VPDGRDRLVAISGDGGLVSCLCQHSFQELADSCVIVDDEDGESQGVNRLRSRIEKQHEHKDIEDEPDDGLGKNSSRAVPSDSENREEGQADAEECQKDGWRQQPIACACSGGEAKDKTDEDRAKPAGFGDMLRSRRFKGVT